MNNATTASQTPPLDSVPLHPMVRCYFRGGWTDGQRFVSDIDAALEEQRQIGGELRVSAYLNIGAPKRLELVPDVVEVAPYRYETDAEVATRLLASKEFLSNHPDWKPACPNP
jgi:hypothetical protein